MNAVIKRLNKFKELPVDFCAEYVLSTEQNFKED